MNNNFLILIFQILVSWLLVGIILIQTGGKGLRDSFGGSNFLRSRKGTERLFFLATIALAVLFLLGALLNTLIFLK